LQGLVDDACPVVPPQRRIILPGLEPELRGLEGIMWLIYLRDDIGTSLRVNQYKITNAGPV